MPSNRDPKSAVAAGAGKLPAGTVPATALTFPSGGGAGAALAAHINDPSNAHMASAIGYLGGPAWVDGTTNPAADVEVQLDKIITDLIATAGAARLGATDTGNFADGNPATGADIQTLINSVVSMLAASAGAGRVGAVDTGNFADGNPASGADVQALANAIVAALASTAGAAKIGSVNTGNWADGNPTVGADVQALINAIVADLAGVFGTDKIGGNAYSGAPYSLVANPASLQLTSIINQLNTVPVRTLTTTDTLHSPSQDQIINLATTGGSFTLTLSDPTLAYSLHRVYLFNSDGAMSPMTNSVTLARFGTEKINGLAADYRLDAPWGRWILMSDGVDWIVI